MQAAIKLHPLEFVRERYRWDPLGFVLDCFSWGEGEGPDEWQTKVLSTIRDEYSLTKALRIAVASGHGIGKTALIAWIILWFISTRENPQIVVTANTKEQLEKKTWRELAKWQERYEFGLLFEWSATTFRLKEARGLWFASAVPWSETNSEAFAGTHEKHVLIIFDEASRIADIIWEVAEGAMTTPGAIFIAFGNPTQNTGRFRECFGRFRHRWITMQVDSRTAKMTDKAQIQQWVDDYGEDSDFVRVRVKGEFPRASAMQFIGNDLVAAAAGKHLREDQYSHMPVVLGVDVARYGDDASTIYKRQGSAVWKLWKGRGIDNMTLAGLVAQTWRDHNADACFIDHGGGSGVIDRLRQMGLRPFEIPFGSTATKDKIYANKRAEMWGNMRDWFRTGSVAIPDDPDLKMDLIGPEYGFDSKDRIILERKEDMKSRGLASPDDADALALTFAENVVPRRMRDGMPQGHMRARQDFNPLEVARC